MSIHTLSSAAETRVGAAAALCRRVGRLPASRLAFLTHHTSEHTRRCGQVSAGSHRVTFKRRVVGQELEEPARAGSGAVAAVLCSVQRLPSGSAAFSRPTPNGSIDRSIEQRSAGQFGTSSPSPSPSSNACRSPLIAQRPAAAYSRLRHSRLRLLTVLVLASLSPRLTQH